MKKMDPIGSKGFEKMRDEKDLIALKDGVSWIPNQEKIYTKSFKTVK